MRTRTRNLSPYHCESEQHGTTYNFDGGSENLYHRKPRCTTSPFATFTDSHRSHSPHKPSTISRFLLLSSLFCASTTASFAEQAPGSCPLSGSRRFSSSYRPSRRSSFTSSNADRYTVCGKTWRQGRRWSVSISKLVRHISVLMMACHKTDETSDYCFRHHQHLQRHLCPRPSHPCRAWPSTRQAYQDVCMLTLPRRRYCMHHQHCASHLCEER